MPLPDIADWVNWAVAQLSPTAGPTPVLGCYQPKTAAQFDVAVWPVAKGHWARGAYLPDYVDWPIVPRDAPPQTNSVPLGLCVPAPAVADAEEPFCLTRRQTVRQTGGWRVDSVLYSLPDWSKVSAIGTGLTAIAFAC